LFNSLYSQLTNNDSFPVTGLFHAFGICKDNAAKQLLKILKIPLIVHQFLQACFINAVVLAHNDERAFPERSIFAKL